MSVSLDRVEAVAPDQASLNAAKKLLKAKQWPGMFVDAAGELLWGECQGSGANPYRMSVAVHDLGAKCSCPSRKFPCKHSIALMWWRAEEPDRFVVGEVPDWVTEWLSRRRGAAGAPAGGDDPAKPRPVRSIAAAAEVEPKVPKDPAKAAAARERNRKAREAGIARGLDELDQWILDQLDHGFGGAAARIAERVGVASRRLADAKATGLANRLDGIGADYFASSDEQRQDLLVRELGGLHLLAEAYRRQDRLPAELRHDVRRQVGWSTPRAELLTDTSALRVRGMWKVIGSLRESQPDKLLRCETWLARVDDNGDVAPDAIDEPSHALLLDYVPRAMARGWSPPALRGDLLVGELVYQRSAAPLVAMFGESEAVGAEDVDPSRRGAPRTSVDVVDALRMFEERLAAQPFLRAVGCSARGVVRCDSTERLWLVGSDGDTAVALHPKDIEAARPLCDAGYLSLHGFLDEQALVPLAAHTALGPWWNELR